MGTAGTIESADKTADMAVMLAEKDAEIARLRQRVKLLEKALFGPRSERIVDEGGSQGQFEALLAELEELSATLEQAEAAAEPAPPPSPKPRKQRRSLAELVPDDLPVERIVLEPPVDERICLETGEPLRRIGEDISRKLAFKPGSYYWREYVRPKYAAAGHPEQGILQAPMPELAIPGSDYDETFLAGIAIDKCSYHLPLYRQEERLRHQGIELNRQILGRLYGKTAEVLRPLYDALKADVLGRGVIFTDDTPVNLLVPGRGKALTGRMWVYVGGGAGPPYRVFDFTIDRRKNRPQEFLGDYRGYIHADAYAGYADLFARAGVENCGCWMHVRRKILEAEDGPPELRAAVLSCIRRLYRYERFGRRKAAQWREASRDPSEAEALILRVRKERILPVIDRIFTLTREALVGGDLLPGSAMHGAIGYLHNLGDALCTFCTDPHLEPDNGVSERAIRPLAIGRKNWLFAGSKRGGQATATLLSLIQSARACQIDPFEYLTDVLRRINRHPHKRLGELLPQAWHDARSKA